MTRERIRRTTNFTFHFFELISNSVSSRICVTQLLPRYAAILVAVNPLAIYSVCVLLVSFNRFVEHAKLIKAFHIISHLCFVSSSIDQSEKNCTNEFLRTHTSIQLKMKPKWNETQMKERMTEIKMCTTKYSHSISYNNNYDRYKYFIRQ